MSYILLYFITLHCETQIVGIRKWYAGHSTQPNIAYSKFAMYTILLTYLLTYLTYLHHAHQARKDVIVGSHLAVSFVQSLGTKRRILPRESRTNRVYLRDRNLSRPFIYFSAVNITAVTDYRPGIRCTKMCINDRSVHGCRIWLFPTRRTTKIIRTCCVSPWTWS